jgi:hypothetical protein
MGRRIVFGLAAMVLALGMAAVPADAAKKKCKKLCKPAFTACKAECASLSGAEKRQCKKDCKADYKALKLLCKERAETADPASCSPSGAFVD